MKDIASRVAEFDRLNQSENKCQNPVCDMKGNDAQDGRQFLHSELPTFLCDLTEVVTWST